MLRAVRASVNPGEKEKRRRSQFPLGISSRRKLMLLLLLLISQQIRRMPDILAAVFRPRTDLCTAADPKKHTERKSKPEQEEDEEEGEEAVKVYVKYIENI